MATARNRLLLLQLDSMGEDVDAQLAARYRVLQWPAGGPAPADEDLRAVRVAVTSVRRGFPTSMFERLPALQAVCSWGVGYDTLDLRTAASRGVGISNTPGVLDGCVADLAWALLLAAARRVAVGDRYVKDGRWLRIGEFPLTTRVSGKRLGILGLGRIGSAIARRGAGFDMEIRYSGRQAHAEASYAFEKSLIELARWSDFLIVACTGGPQTRHLVDADVLHALGADGILVNVARGSVIDQQALVSALAHGRLGGAGLDVLEGEPSVPDPLRRLEQVVLMPHVGSATRETRADMAQLVLNNVNAFFETGRLLTAIAT